MKQCIFFLLVAVMASSCTTTRYVPVEHVRTDTLRQVVNQRDSIYLHDSTYVRVAGDTVTIDRWHTRYRDRWRTDTIYQSRVDSVPVPVEVIKEVPAELAWWQKVFIFFGQTLLFAALAIVLLYIAKRGE